MTFRKPLNLVFPGGGAVAPPPPPRCVRSWLFSQPDNFTSRDKNLSCLILAKQLPLALVSSAKTSCLHQASGSLRTRDIVTLNENGKKRGNSLSEGTWNIKCMLERMCWCVMTSLMLLIPCWMMECINSSGILMSVYFGALVEHCRIAFSKRFEWLWKS